MFSQSFEIRNKIRNYADSGCIVFSDTFSVTTGRNEIVNNMKIPSKQIENKPVLF